MCNSLFFGLPKYSLLKLQRVQNAAVRTIFSLKKRESVSDHITSLHWLTVDQRVAFKILLLVFKCLNMMAPHPLIDLLKVKDSYTNKLEVNTFFPSSEIGKRAFCYSAPRLWNCLPTSLRVLDNTDSFKAKLKHFLFTDYRDMMQSYNQYKCRYGSVIFLWRAGVAVSPAPLGCGWGRVGGGVGWVLPSSLVLFFCCS